jgi:ADP-L-glycero-D-manno-heptose 6-epimerase
MYTVVTGAAGFIGSNVIKALNARGEDRVIAVDNLAQGDKFRNLADCTIADYFDQDEFVDRLEAGDLDDQIGAILHQGACADTTESDGRYMLRNNYRYSVRLLHYCQDNDLPLIYASSAAVYGAGSEFVEDPRCEAPINVYAYSKLLFDQYVRRLLPECTAPIVGLRYFNVYGPREQHKGRMASVAFHFFNQYRSEGRVRLFEGSGGYSAGEQRRDFVHIDDVVNANLWFLDQGDRSGVFNVGSGNAATFNAVAAATINACRTAAGEPALSFDDLHRGGAIEYIPFPAELVGKYQSFTQADLSQLREAGYTAPTIAIDDGVPRYIRSLLASA